MIRLVEGAVFLAIATGIHVGLWSVSPQDEGVSSSGDAGASAITLQASTASHAALVTRWEAPPQVSAQPTPVAAPAPMATATAPGLGRTPPQIALPDRPALPDAATAPRADVAPPAAPVTPPQTTLDQPPSPDLTTSAQQTARTEPAPTRPTAPPLPQPQRTEAPRADTTPPAPRASQPAQPRARAEGTPTKATPKAGGSTGTQQTAALAPARANALRAKWGARIQRKVHRNMSYPRGASGSGTARLELTIDRTGRLRGVRVLRSSGVAAFDQAAVSAARRAGRFPKAPAGLTDASFSFALSLTFSR